MVTYNKQCNVFGITARLCEFIQNMSEEKQLELLSRLDKERKQTRKHYIIPVDYSTQNDSYRDFITNISEGGLFIDTKESFSVGQALWMTLAFPNHPNPLKIKGKVVWIISEGIGVKFENLDPQQLMMIQSFVKSI